jgi:hypothetical protein
MKSLILSLALALFALPAWAVNDWGYSGCSSSGSSLNQSGHICFDFDSDFTAGLTANFYVNAGTALACFDPNVATAGASVATGQIWYCPFGGTTTAACGVQVCAAGGCILDGANGVPASQTACVVIGPGAYILESVVAPAAETGLFNVRGGQ